MNLSGLNIVADENIPALESLFDCFGKITRIPGRSMKKSDLKEADILLVRSVTKVDRALLEGTPVSFVGTATIGTDHIDQHWLHEQGIGFSSAPGCNADAVAEYVLSNLLLVAREQGFDLLDKVVGIVGVGNVGRRLQRRLERLGVKLLLNDPPRQSAGTEGMVPLDQLLKEADIICLHTPLVKDGKYPSHHLLNQDNLPLVKQGAVLLNAGRGPVIDNTALLNWHLIREDVTLLLDVWEDEPRVGSELAERVRIGTPHIAGYSLDGKIRGTWMLYNAFCEHRGLVPDVDFKQCLSEIVQPVVKLTGKEDLTDIIHMIYDPADDHARFMSSLDDAAMQPERFDQLRKQYPVRREFAAAGFSGAKLASDLKGQLVAAGFICD
ncbi:4-phosphoerythronate dehydrogenase PdxB [Amphritea balenae]|uniref:Erythronate-4-phosphate dehydrogenase n=1 Tax=Amphritea balenae TaxID=452629 RepID=A0A3P1SHS7_9GAMM|nr:4-phosphoerythronate dehydrogenase PdxB [Amphritea balenae]RRC96831.1 4-phosphoerythronate dehydrogenase PdxB [Amphritea balenae]GGK61356.1 erythronate-4-phosphate dehydrogenase [Amphritea balenae]